MAPGRSPATGQRTPSIARALVPLVLALAILAVAAPALASQYEGPGHRGEVPLGDGGLLAGLAPLVGQGITHVEVTGIAPEICKIVFDDDDAYANATLVWSPGNETAYIGAQAGARDAPFRIAAHWELDMNDECTVEVTKEGRTWHDPRGRPFIDIQYEDRFLDFDVVTGDWTPVYVELHNNGTLSERVNIATEHMRDTWQIRNATAFMDVEIGPLETKRFGFELLIPDGEPSRTNLLLFNVEGKESGFRERLTLVLEVESSGRPANDTDEEAPVQINQRGQPPPEWTPGSSGQIPVASPIVGLVAVVLIVGLKRRFSR